MVWKARREKTTTLKQSTTGSHSSSATMGKLPRKSCLRSQEFSLDSDWSNGGSSVSSQRSETVRCESSLNSAPATSTISTRISSPTSESLDAQNCKVSRAAEPPVAETTTRSSGSHSTSSQKSKNVRFSVVEIRDYAREVADNPSCSSGPPIGIGWRHLDSRVVHVNHYEHSRPYRKGQLELVLTREEREALLAEWGVSTQDIVSSTRALIKAKNQRRQTVRNLNKAERVEEGLEKATRTLLRLLSFRKSTKVELEQLQRQAEFAAALSPARFEEVDEPEETKQTQSEGEVSSSSSRAEITEKEDGVLGDFEVKLGPSVGPGNISQERTVVKDEMDTISCISGFTLGNSTTASALEIERFHRELELELFGDQELPSMVGQTLEVDVEIPEEDKVFHDPSPICGTQEPPSVVSDSINPESLPHGGYGNHIPSHRYPTMYHPPPINPLEQQSLPRPNFHNGQVYDSYGNYQMQIRGHTANYEFRLPGSLDSATEANGFIGKSPDTHTNFEATRQPHAPYNLAQASSNYATGSRWTDVTPKFTVNQPTDGPLVTHVPLASHLSPNNWMEGSHSQFRSSPSRTPWDAVIISEDDLDEVQQHYVEQASMMPLFHG